MNQSTLRKAAILVSVLDARSADALLESMPADHAAKVRAAVMNLDDVSVAEQERVIQEFLGKEQPAADDDVELELSAAGTAVAVEEAVETEKSPTRGTQPGYPTVAATISPDAAKSPPFTFLNAADGSTIAAVLIKEQPQLSAAVLAHLPPTRAAEVLGHLPGYLAGEILVRIAHLDELSPDVLLDIEQQLQTTLSPHLRSKQESQQGFARLQAILTSSTPTQREMMLGAVARKDQQLAGDLHRQTKKQSPEGSSQKRVAAKLPNSVGQPSEEKSPQATSRIPRQANADLAVQFNDLFALDDAAWQMLLQTADQNVVLLAFAGAEPKLISRILRGFPRREADLWRKEFSHPGPVRLRDIDTAQATLVRLACELFKLQPLVQPRQNYAAVA